MNKLILVGIAFLFSSILIGQVTAEEFIKKGKTFYDAENYIDAEKIFSEGSLKFPNNYNLTLNLADSKHKQEMFKEAIKLYDKAEDLNSTDSELYFNRGAAYVFIDAFKKADIDFNKAIELGNKSAEIYYYKGFVNASQDKLKTAIENYSIAIKLNPDYAEAYYNRGAAKSELKNYEEGMKDFQVAMDKKPDLEYGRINIALSKIGQKQYVDAIKDLNIVINQRKDNLAKALYYRGEAYYELKNKEKACDDWLKASELKYEQATKNISSFCGKNIKERKEIDIVF